MTARLLMTTDAVGGVWRYALDLARGLAAEGVETTLLGFGPRPDATQRAEAEAVADLVWSDLPLDWSCRDAAEVAGVPEVIARHAARAKADLVQVNAPSQAAGLAPGVPVVAAAHSCVTSWFRVVKGSGLPRGWRWQQTLTRGGLSEAQAVIAPSRSFAQLLRGCHPGIGRVEVVPNASATPTSTGPRQRYAYAAARWWDEGKNAATLDDAAARCRQPLYAAGATDGPDGQRIRFDHARPLGQVDQARLFELGAAAAVFVSPSIYEPFGLAALEAARLGAALVLADIPTYRELWDGAALFAEPRDPEAFAAAIDVLTDQPDLRRSLVQRATTRAAIYTVEAQAARMLAIYRDLAPRHEPMGAA